ncbi:hypothetical protein SCHPADRAFT_919531 [Schizopora paradoxa]|uniref:Ribosome assembly protein 3 n=1 Tax=Schizopora paradoxa TaxID=27342 RepID=A0A0H2S6G8_9AGAM|nr:hypothetical protein SCHPADRAFT_919531 [Schizopora paradoxa]
MAGATQKPDARKRNRKRKRRNVSISSSSESSDSSDSSSGEQVVKLPTKTSAKAPLPHDSSSSSSSSSEDSSDSESEPEDSHASRKTQSAPSQPVNTDEQDDTLPSSNANANRLPRSPSPPPLRNVPPPQLILSRDAAGNLSSSDAEKEKQLKDKFRKFWMSSIADAFSDDLNEIRKEPNLTQSRLELLIDSLASGADLYSTSREMGSSRVNEIGIILGDKTSK